MGVGSILAMLRLLSLLVMVRDSLNSGVLSVLDILVLAGILDRVVPGGGEELVVVIAKLVGNVCHERVVRVGLRHQCQECKITFGSLKFT